MIPLTVYGGKGLKPFKFRGWGLYNYLSLKSLFEVFGFLSVLDPRFES